MPAGRYAGTLLSRSAVATLIALAIAVAVAVLSASGAARAQTPVPPGAPSISSVTAGDRQLTVNWNAATTPGDKPVVDYRVEYRAGSSGDWQMASSYDISFDSPVQTGTDTTWAHNRNPLDLGPVTGDAAPYVERTKGGHHNLDGVYRIKQAVAAVRFRVSGTTDGAGTLRSNYTKSPIADLRHSGDSMGANVVNASATNFELTAVAQDLLANSYIWIDGWDHTSANTKFPEFEDVSISDRRLHIDIATASTALNINIDSLTNQRSYQVRVRARNSDGWGPWSAASGGTPLGVADAPAGLSSVSGNNQLALSWNAPANNGGYAVTDYDIQYRALTGQTWGSWTDWQGSTVSAATSTTIDSGVVNGTKYQARVRAVNSAGDGDWSAPITDTAGKPSQPTFAISNVQRPLPAGRSDRGGLLSMTLDAPANGSAVTDYDLRYRESGTTTWYTYRDRSLDSGRLSGSKSASNTVPIDFGAFSNLSGAVAVERESLGSGYVYKFTKSVDQLWIRASGTITGGGTVVAHWHTEKPTAAQVATLGTQIFSVNTSVNTESDDHTFWQDGWVTNLPANAYVWFYTTDSETLTKRRLQLDFTDNTASPPQVNDSGIRRTSETVGLGEGNVVDPIDFGAFTTPPGGVPVTRESVTYGGSTKQGYYKIGAATGRFWIRVSGKLSVAGHARVIGCWLATKPTDPFANCSSASNQVFNVVAQTVGGKSTFDESGWVYNLPANGYIWVYVEGLEVKQTARTLTERRLQLDFDRGRIVLSGLRNGKTYELQARAKNARGWGAWSTSVSGTAGAPTPPVVNTPTPKHQAIAVTWDAPASDNASAVTGYDVQYRAGSSGAWSSWPHTDTTRSATITGLTNNTEYQVQVRARNARGNGLWSASVKATPAIQKPDAPAAPTMTSSGTTLTVTWAAPLSNGADITDYDIEYSSDNGANWTPHLHGSFAKAVNTSTTTNTTIPLDFGALNPTGLTVTNESVGSNAGIYKIGQTLGALKVHVSTITTQAGVIDVYYADTKPSASTLRSHGTKLFSLTLSQNVIGNASGTIPTPAANSYFWAVGASALSSSTRTIGLNWPTVSTSTTDSISSLTNGASYQVRVRARNSVGTGDWSPASTHAIGRPGAPAAPTLTSGNAQLTAKWSAPAGTVTITDYDVQYSSNGGATWTEWNAANTSTDLEATITNLNNGTTYQVQVRAESSLGPGPWSPTASIKAGLPEGTSGIRVEPVSDGLYVYFTVPPGNGSVVTSLDIRYSSNGGTTWTEHLIGLESGTPTGANFRYPVTGLTNGVAYQVQVRAKNQHGAGPWSDVYTATPGTPDAPSAPTLTAGDHKLLVNWSAPGNNGSAITDYDVRYSANGGSSWSEWQPNADSAANSAVITGLTPDTTYQVQVRATNTHGDSAWSASSTHTLAVSPVPTLSFHYCNPSKLNQLWVDNACFIKAGQHGTKAFNSARVASGGDYVELTDYSGTVQALPYNPNGGLAIVETLDSNNVVQDTFQIDVIRFQIRDTEVTGTLKAMESSYLTVRLHSLSNGSPDKFLVNGSDFARSWVQLDLPNELIAQDHNDTWQNDPIQVVDHHGDSVTFRMIPTSAGAFSIGIAAYRPAPDAGCPTEGELRCFQPPVDRLTKEYVAAAQVSVQAAFAAPNPPAAPANLAASAGDGSVTLSWDDPQNPTISRYEYNVNHNDTNSGNLSGWSAWQSIAGSDADTTSHTFSGLANGREYRFHVRAVNAGGNGAGAPNAAPWYVSAIPEEPPPDPPGAVSAVSVTREDGSLTASWDAPDGATKYHATYTDDGGKSWHAPVDNHTNIPTNSLTFSVDNAKTYVIGVRAGNDAGWSGWRNSPSAGPYIPPNTPTPTSPPDTVSSVTVTRSDGSLTASWDAPDGATKYHVTYTDDGGKSWHAPVDDHTNVPTNSLSFSIDNAKTYIIGVRAGNDIGWSGWRNSPPAAP